MADAEEELDSFTEAEKSKRITALREYAAELIVNMQVDNGVRENDVSSNLDAIIEP